MADTAPKLAGIAALGASGLCLLIVAPLAVFIDSEQAGGGALPPPGSGIPAVYMPIYALAERSQHVNRWLLASIHYQETRFSTTSGPSFVGDAVRVGWNECGAAGPMQMGIAGVAPYLPSVDGRALQRRTDVGGAQACVQEDGAVAPGALPADAVGARRLSAGARSRRLCLRCGPALIYAARGSGDSPAFFASPSPPSIERNIDSRLATGLGFALRRVALGRLAAREAHMVSGRRGWACILALVVALVVAPAVDATHLGDPIEASCSPSGSLTLARGNPLVLDIGTNNNDHSASAVYTANFTATMAASTFFGPANVIYTKARQGGSGLATGGVDPVSVATTSTTPLGTGQVVVEVTSDQTGGTVLATCTIALTVIDPGADSDGDGLLDGWEVDGIDANSDGTIDLPLDKAPFNARWDHKDLFVEIDYMDSNLAGSNCGSFPSASPVCSVPAHSHLPNSAALGDVVAAFGAAPVANPDSVGGIALHLMVDEAIPEWHAVKFMSEEPGTTNDFNDLKAGDPAVACDGRLGTGVERLHPNCAQILAARRKAFRYGVIGHRVHEKPDANGIGELPGNDFLITVDAGYAGGGLSSSQQLQAATIMHEFGHNLGLGHGGGDPVNCKPNYISVMNYTYDAFLLDYSRQLLPTLNETSLSEPAGIGGPAALLARYAVGGISRSAAANGPIDWNGNGQSTDTGVRADVNYDTSEPGCDPSPAQPSLTGYQDWSKIRYKLEVTGDYADGPTRSTPHAEDDPTAAEFLAGFDADSDGVKDGSDNCAALANADQANGDGDQLGDVCDPLTYRFGGFLSPVDPLPTFNTMKAGASIPVRFSLNGDQGLGIFAPASPGSRPVACETSAPLDVVEETATAGSSALSYDAVADEYTYVWKTDKLWARSCRELLLELADGGVRRARFNFTR